MTINQRYVFFLCYLLTALWWGWSLLVDVVIVPTVFSSVPDFFTAGELGIALFSKFNKLELITSSALIALLGWQLIRNKKVLPWFICAITCWTLVMFYFAYLTPKIIQMTSLWKEASIQNQIGIAGIADIQQEHQYFHKLYITLDACKLLILSFMMVFGIINEDKWA